MVKIQIVILRVMNPCSIGDSYQRFGVKCCFHLRRKRGGEGGHHVLPTLNRISKPSMIRENQRRLVDGGGKFLRNGGTDVNIIKEFRVELTKPAFL